MAVLVGSSIAVSNASRPQRSPTGAGPRNTRSGSKSDWSGESPAASAQARSLAVPRDSAHPVIAGSSCLVRLVGMPFLRSVTSILDEFPCLPGEMQRYLWQKASDSESGAAKQDEPLSHTRYDRVRYSAMGNSYAIGPIRTLLADHRMQRCRFCSWRGFCPSTKAGTTGARAQTSCG